MSDNLDYALASKLLRYEPRTGKLFWLLRPEEMFASKRAFTIWNIRFAGKEALTFICPQGYAVGSILDKRYKAHRLVWLLVNGSWPSGQIDHINGVPSDNRIENLRDVTFTDNMRNTKRRRNNVTGVCGVHWNVAQQQWAAAIRVNHKAKHLGYYDEFEAAVSRRKAAEIEEGFHPNHGRAA